MRRNALRPSTISGQALRQAQDRLIDALVRWVGATVCWELRCVGSYGVLGATVCWERGRPRPHAGETPAVHTAQCASLIDALRTL